MLLCLAALLFVSCTDPKSDPKAAKDASKPATQTGLSSSVMTPITAPMQARKHLRQQVRIVNHQTQLRNQKMQGIQNQGQPGR